MIINSGAATGIAIVSNALTSRHSFHQAQLATDHLLNSIPQHGDIAAMAWLMAYHDMYKVLAIVIVLLAPWCLLLKSGNGVQNPAKPIFD
jgi:hypothetical protein